MKVNISIEWNQRRKEMNENDRRMFKNVYLKITKLNMNEQELQSNILNECRKSNSHNSQE